MDKETKEMFEILHKNKEKVRLEERQVEQQKEQNKRTILTGIVLALAIILLIVLMGKLNNDFLNNCTKGGLSESVCRLSM